jgi:hypothetical protein
MDEAEAKGRVLVVSRGDQRDPIGVALDADFGFRSGYAEPAVGLRQRRQEIEDEPAAEGDQQRKQARENAPDPGIPLPTALRMRYGVSLPLRENAGKIA